jgi:hypothetical protein
MPPSDDMLAQRSTHLGRLQYRVERFERAGSKECGDENRRAGDGGVTFLAVNAIGGELSPGQHYLEASGGSHEEKRVGLVDVLGRMARGGGEGDGEGGRS